MRITYENLLSCSFFAWINNRVQNDGGGYINYSSQFFPINPNFNGYYSYSAPFSQFISDSSVSGATVMTGIYLNKVLISTGQSGFVGIDYERANVYFNQKLPANSIVSGNYSIKELNCLIPTFYDLDVLFETKLNLRPKYFKPVTGLNNNELSYPAIFIKAESSPDSTPFAFGGTVETRTVFNAYVFADSQFQLDSVMSLMKDSKYKYIPLLNANEQPYNNLGGLKNGQLYNYTGLVGNRISMGSGALIESVEITDWSRRGGIGGDITKLTTEAFFSLATFTLWYPRLPV